LSLLFQSKLIPIMHFFIKQKTQTISCNFFLKYILLFSFLIGCTGKEQKENSKNEISIDKSKKVVSTNVLLKDLKKPWDTNLIGEIAKIAETDQKYRSVSEKQYRKNAVFQSYIDSLNTKRFIEIIEKYGYPSPEMLKKKANTTIILMHAPVSFFPQIKKLIDEENKLGHIHEYEYELLKWHLSGRIGPGP